MSAGTDQHRERSPGDDRPRLLYCTPVLPALHGNGLAMRAGTVLRALAERYRVTLLVVPRYSSPVQTVPEPLAQCCHQIVVAEDARLPDATAAFGDAPFDAVHVFRLATYECLQLWLERLPGRPARHLDLDDVESVTRRRIADRYAENGRPEDAQVERSTADRAVEAEWAALHWFDRVYVCSDSDRAALEAQHGEAARASIAVLPNALLPLTQLGPPPPAAPCTFLFVGTLGHYPNEDGIVAFCRDTLPALRLMATRPFRVRIVGRGVTPTIEALGKLPGVEVVGVVDDLAAEYRQAHAAIVPLQAGGGTRIKILEAFAYGRPIVTTAVGLEGIAARHGEHVLVADRPADFARQCARTIASPGLAARLIENARRLFDAEYSYDALIRHLHALP